MKTLFLTALEISLSTGVIGLLLLLTSQVLNRRYAAKWKYGIWIALALRLLLPFKLTLPQRQLVLDVPAQLARPVASPVTAMAAAPELTQTAAAQSLSPLDILAAVWLAGAALFLLAHLLSYAHYRRTLLRHGQRVTDVSVLQQIRAISQELHIRRRMPVLRDITAGSPMVIGFFRPILVMPDMEYQPMELYFVLKHELIHLKRHDMFAKLLFVAANALHWFNPIVYLMQRQAVVDMELSCDERVVKGTVFETRKAYTETLLSTLCRRHGRSTTLSTQFFGDKAVMKKRFQNIMTRARKRSGLTVLIVVLLSAALLGAAFGLSVGESEVEEAPTDPVGVQATEVVGAPDSTEGQFREIGNIVGDFANAYLFSQSKPIEPFLCEDYAGNTQPCPVPQLEPGSIASLAYVPQDGDIGLLETDEVSVYNETVPNGSTITALYGMNDPDIRLLISLIREESGWKVRDYRLLQDETQQITQLAQTFTNALFTGDKDTVKACRSRLSSDSFEETYEDAGFLEIHEVKGVPYYLAPPEDMTIVTVSVEFRAREYGEDSYTYLTLELIKEPEGWRVFSYAIEK
ncbi:MAG: M56 family metallopeptidase [Eubacteriales bacterium]|nr:M56 family metallopeptidase [Eubacteriales bacterium]